jgi:hypothetical protein
MAGMAIGGAMSLWKAGRKMWEAHKSRKIKKEMESTPEGRSEHEAAREDPDKAAALADKVQAKVSDSGRYANEMRTAYLAGRGGLDKARWAFKLWSNQPGRKPDDDPGFVRTGELIEDPADRPTAAAVAAFDAERLLGAINVTPSMIESRSGQDLIVKKISSAEAM